MEQRVARWTVIVLVWQKSECQGLKLEEEKLPVDLTRLLMI